MPSGARAISGPAGSWRRCAAAASTAATGCAWRSRPAPCPAATGRAVTPRAGISARPTSTSSSSAPSSSATTLSTASWSMRAASASSTRAPIRALTYARMGRAILAQPGQVAWQIYDRKVAHLLHDEYRAPPATRYRGETLAELAGQLDGIDRAALQATIAEFNRAVRQDVAFDPGKKDGRSTSGLAMPKSNWASTIDEPPFEAFPVTCGITFTFGGVRTDRAARVLDVDGGVIPGLYAA